MRARSPFAAVLLVSLIAWPTHARAAGFADARAGRAAFKVAPKVKNSVNLVSKAPGETFKGTSRELHGSLTLDPAVLDSAIGQISVPFKSLDTGNAMRNQHMLSPRWIDAEKNPDAVFVVEGIDKVKITKSTAKATLKGKWQIHGQEKPADLPVTLVYQRAKSDAEHDRLAIRTSFNIKLADFGIEDGAIGKKVATVMRLSVAVTLEAGAEKPDAPAAGSPS
ncbi:MAG: YceI family protein [Phycisphaerae bacterium]